MDEVITWWQALVLAAFVAFFAFVTSGPLGGYLYAISALVCVGALILFVMERRN